jgi:hypothetical protein
MGWQWQSGARQYVDTATGAVISKDELASLQADFVTKMGDQFRETATGLHQRGASPDEWETALRPIVDRTQAIGYQLSRGGSQAMSADDWSTVSDLISKQYDYLNAFAQDAGTGQLTEEEAADRAALYGDAGRGAYANGLGAAWEVDLPEYPPVHPGCRCAWDIAETDDGGVQARWIASDPCPICADLEAQYNPYNPATGE